MEDTGHQFKRHGDKLDSEIVRQQFNPPRDWLGADKGRLSETANPKDWLPLHVLDTYSGRIARYRHVGRFRKRGHAVQFLSAASNSAGLRPPRAGGLRRCLWRADQQHRSEPGRAPVCPIAVDAAPARRHVADPALPRRGRGRDGLAPRARGFIWAVVRTPD